MAPVHNNPHVVEALQHFHGALLALNAAGHPYDIGIRGEHEPYGLLEEAVRRTLEHAFPELDTEAIMHGWAESGESFAYVIRSMRNERLELLDYQAEQAAIDPRVWPPLSHAEQRERLMLQAMRDAGRV